MCTCTCAHTLLYIDNVVVVLRNKIFSKLLCHVVLAIHTNIAKPCTYVCICEWTCKNQLNCHNSRNPVYCLATFRSRHANYEAIDGQVCFHKRSFANPVRPQWSTTGYMGPLMGTNKAAWGVKLLLTTISAYQVDCGSF